MTTWGLVGRCWNTGYRRNRRPPIHSQAPGQHSTVVSVARIQYRPGRCRRAAQTTKACFGGLLERVIAGRDADEIGHG